MTRKFFFTDESGDAYPVWEQKKLGEVATLVTGNTPPTDNASYWNGDYPWATPGDMGRKKYINSTRRKVTKLGLEKSRYLPAGTLIVTCIGATIGKSAILSVEGSCNQQNNAVLPSDSLSVEYVYYIMEIQIDKMKDLSGKTATPILNKTAFGKLHIPIPSLPEQEKIAEFFSVLDENIELHETKIALLKERKKGYLQKVFSGELAFTDDNGERYPAWEQKKLGEVATLKMGFTPSTDNTDFWQGDIPWLSIAGFNRKYIENGTKFISEEALGKKKVLPSGSLVMSFKLTLGKLGILKNPMVTNEAICSFEWKNDITTSEFAFYALSSLKFEKFANRAAAGLTLNDKTLKLLPISLPSLPEQEKIAEFFSVLDEEIELNENKLALLREQKKGYLQGIFG